MNLELLQQALIVKVDHKQLYPAITEYNGIDVPKFVLT